MFDMISRLRRSVALTICPELRAEVARDHAGRRELWLQSEYVLVAQARRLSAEGGRAVSPDDPVALYSGVIAPLRRAVRDEEERLRREGVSPVVSVERSEVSGSWKALTTQEEAEAYLATASGEELRVMAGRLLADHPVCRAEAGPLQLIVRALCANHQFSRRLTGALAEGRVLEARLRHPGSGKGL